MQTMFNMGSTLTYIYIIAGIGIIDAIGTSLFEAMGLTHWVKIFGAVCYMANVSIILLMINSLMKTTITVFI